jgi:hypothetical protein
MFAGVRVVIGDRELVMPWLTYGDTKKAIRDGFKLKKQAELAETAENPEVFIEVADLKVATIHRALLRNYPELTLQEVEDGIANPDVGTYYETLMAMCRGDRKPDVNFLTPQPALEAPTAEVAPELATGG